MDLRKEISKFKEFLDDNYSFQIPDRMIHDYFQSEISMSECERQPVTDNKGNGNNFKCVEAGFSADKCVSQCNACKESLLG